METEGPRGLRMGSHPEEFGLSGVVTVDSPSPVLRSGREAVDSLLGLSRKFGVRSSLYLLVVGLTIAILVCVLRLWEADLAVPLCDQGDSLCAQAWMKSILEHGWFLHNPDLGAPWGSDLYDFPMADDVHFFTIRLLCMFVRAPGMLFNLYVFLQFPLIACSACFVMRQLGIDSSLALVGSILYAFLPFHLFRGMSHVFLASYYLVPLQVLMVIRLGQGPIRDNRPPLRRRLMGFLGLLLFCFIVGGAGIYNAFFGCFFVLLAGIYALLQGRGWTSLQKAGFICVTTCAAVLVHLAPQMSYLLHNGLNPEAVIRSSSEAEVLGLKLAHLLLPVSGHRDAYFAQLKDRYLSGGILNNENRDASLGLLGSAAFLFLLIHLLRRKSDQQNSQRRALDTLAIVNLGAILLGTIGGFGVLFSLFISSWIRAYNRISVFVAFFAFAGAALAIDPLVRHLANRPWGRLLSIGASIGLLSFGIWDQTCPDMAPNYESLASNRLSDAAFVGALERDLTPGAMVFQLPYLIYPEAMSFGRCEAYDHLKPYLVSHSLRWSFGGFRGRPADALVHMLSSLEPVKMLRTLVLMGFEGLVIDRFGYDDRAAGLERTLSALLGQSPQISNDGRWSSFTLDGFKAKLKTQISEGHWRQAATDMSSPILPLFGAGFLTEERPPDGSFRWAEARADLILTNSEGFPRTVEIEFDADRLSVEPVHLDVIYASGHSKLLIGYGRQRFHLRLTAEPGFTLLRFECDGKPLAELRDSRQLVFRLSNLTVLPESVP